MKHRCWEGEDKITQKETDNTEIHFMSLMNLHDTNLNTRLDDLYRRIMIFFMLYSCLLDLFSTLFLKNYPNLPDSMVIWSNPSRALESRPLLDTFKWLKITGIHWYSKNKAFPSSVFKSVRRESNAWAR